MHEENSVTICQKRKNDVTREECDAVYIFGSGSKGGRNYAQGPKGIRGRNNPSLLNNIGYGAAQ